jgi:hypothetical protein
VSGTHEGRIEGDDYHGFVTGSFNQAFNHLELLGVKIQAVGGHFGPILGLLDGWKGGKNLLILDFDKIHAGVVEKLKMFINCILAALVKWVKMQEKPSRDDSGYWMIVQKTQNKVAFVH